MTQEELDSLLREMTELLRGLDIPVSNRVAPSVCVNGRAKRRLGCCYAQSGGFLIEVSASLLDKPDRLKQTLCHELLHTCRGCRNHGELWKAYAKRVNEATGWEIKRLAEAEGEDLSQPLRRDEIKYVLECQSCGAKIYRTRRSKAVKAPWRYRCKCGGRLALKIPEQT